MVREITLHGAKARGRVAAVDDEDYLLVNQYRWFVHEITRRGRRPDGPYDSAAWDAWHDYAWLNFPEER